MKRVGLVVAAGLVVASLAPAYYHFVHFTSRSAPFVPVPEKFDLSTLVDKTVRYYINQDGPAELAPNDSFASVISQIRLAGKVWNDVGTSELRVAFGGLAVADTEQIAPGIDILFDEMPPGLIAMGGPISRSEMVAGENGSFVPITRGVVILNKDLPSQPSSSENFFLTMVHELGHALGLQHTLTSAVMSTSITRAGTKAAPLGIDDVAAISLLYPTRSFTDSAGAIAGRVSLNGEGVNAASVVALSPQGATISTLTNPDGTYRIGGIPPGQYYVYAHPLPPPMYGEVSPANIVLPRDPDGEPVAVGPVFETRFYPGVTSTEAAVSFAVSSGRTVEGVDFSVQPRAWLGLYAVSTYSFPGNVAVKPGYLSIGDPRPFLVTSGVGLAADGAPAAGLTATVIGGSASVPADGLIPYSPDPRFVQINLGFNPFSGVGARHLLFSLNNDIYVLPAGLHLVRNQPPYIDAIARGYDEQGRPAVVIAGRNVSSNTRILFDGAPASVSSVGGSGLLFVQPPPASGGHRATVVALNSDGQSSLFLHGVHSPTYDYEASGPAVFVPEPSALPAGTEAMVEIRGTNTHFLQGQTTLGLGSSDITVRELWVIDSSHLIANVAVSDNAPVVAVPVTVVSGLEVVTQPLSFRALPPNPSGIAIHTPALNPSTGERGAYPGGAAMIRVSQPFSEVTPADLTMSLNDQPVTILSIENGWVNFEVPTGLHPGPAVLRVRNSLAEAFPVIVTIEVAPPVIAAVIAPDGASIDVNRPASTGELLTLLVAGLGDPGEIITPDRLGITVGAIEHSVYQVIPGAEQPGLYQVQFFLGTTLASGAQVPLTTTFDGRSSTPVFIPIVNPASTGY